MEGTERDRRRFRIDVAYDGRPYEGWQSQAGGNTIQDVLLGELRNTCSDISTVQGSGRTDAGVSADGQVAHFDTPEGWRMTGEEWKKALNAKLPPSIRVMRCREASADFHARFSAEGKIYCYRICTAEVLPPFEAGLAWHVRGFGKDEALRRLLSLYEGKHDFRAFSAKRRDGKDDDRDTVRTIQMAEAIREDEFLSIRLEGDGFLYKMVRFLVGTAVYGCKGKVTEKEIRRWLAGNAGEKKAPYCAPAAGLSLEKVIYPDEFEAA
jgi:tRNA pseudouridine38-40 synthase